MNIIPHRFIKNPEKGRENGVATLNAAKQLTTSQIPTWLQKALNPAGTWDASDGTYPTPTVAGQFWFISVAGTIDEIEYNPKDWLVWTGTEWFKVDNTDLVISVDGQSGAVDLSNVYEPKNANIQSHISDTDNPHAVTQTQVGLGNVDNTSDDDKPISSATQTALNGKSDTTHNHDDDYEPKNDNIQSHIGVVAGNPHGTSYADVGAAATGHDHDSDYEPLNANIQGHISATGNPHSTTPTDIGAEPAITKLPIAQGGSNNDAFTSGKLLYYDGTKMASSGLDIPRINDIGVAGQWGFGVGICDPADLPDNMVPMSGCYDKLSPNYGNYLYANLAWMVYIPMHYVKVVGLLHYVASIYDFADEASALAAGYTIPKAFMNAGTNRKGFFVFKGKATKQAKGAGYVAGCLLPGLPLSTHADHNPILDLTAVTANNYANCIDAAKAIDGVDGAKNPNSIFFPTTTFMGATLAFLSMAHSEMLQSADNMGAWYNATSNFPKGCNNNALKDANDATVVYESDGYSNCGKTGSGKPFNKTTHNGQDCGVCDLNGLMYEVSLGLTCLATSKNITAATKANPCQITCVGHGLVTGDVIQITSVVGMTELNDKMYKATYVDDDNITLDGVDSSAYTDYDSAGSVTTGKFYVLKDSCDITTLTSGNTLATDHWGAVGVAQNFDEINLQSIFQTVSGSNGFARYFGNTTNAVLSPDTTGIGKLLRDLGMPKDTSAWGPGTAKFGNDQLYQYFRNDLCVLRSNDWSSSTSTGVWYVNLSSNRTNSSYNVSFRCACFPKTS